MSANTLTGLIPTLYRAADKVAHEQTGFVAGCYTDADVEQVAKDQTIRYPIVPALTAGDVTPAATGPDAAGKTISYGDMSISKVRSVQIPWNGDEGAGLGRTRDTIMQGFFEQGMRTLLNEMETDLFLAAKRGGSRAYGSAGTTPFGTAGNFSDFAETRRILIDNGAPPSDLHLVLNTTAGAKLRGLQSSLFKVDEAGTDSLLRDGNLGSIEGFTLHESGAIVSHTKGTGTSYVFNGAHSAGATSVVAKTGTNTILYGDIVTFEDDTANKYIVNTGIAAAGTFVIGGPGLRQAQTDGKTITVGNNYLGNFAFNRMGLHLLTRLPLMPSEGDAAADVVVITDPYSGLSFQVALYKQYRQVSYEIGIAWGVKVVKSDFLATLLG
jgi:hypothetical protein